MRYALLSATFALFAFTATAEAGAPTSSPMLSAAVVDNSVRVIPVASGCGRGMIRTPSGRCISERRWRSESRHHRWDRRHDRRYYRERHDDRRWRHHRDRHRPRVYIRPRGPHD